MLSGRFAQAMEACSIGAIVVGIYCLCQGEIFALYSLGFKILVAGWLGLTLWSHRRPIRQPDSEGNPQITLNGHPPREISLPSRVDYTL